ncbi:MAG: GHKL domain-containing protein [Oscillospiraceae bacterium]|nr:GHKL domain-containing protein [Oscillospiraceae bacterium]
MMKFLKSKITRAVAFVLSLVIVFCAVFYFCSTTVKRVEMKKNIESDIFIYSFECSEEYMDLIEKLWLVGNMYLRNLDNNGNLTGNTHYIKSIKENMKKSGLMDESGKLILPETKNFEYMVGFDENTYSNAGITETDENNEYSYCIKNTTLSEPAYTYVCTDMHDMRIMNNGNGMEYYYTNGESYAVFDYDTTGLDSYIDDYGAKIYLNKDGTTPIPSNYVDILESTEFSADYYDGDMIYSEDERYGYEYPITNQEDYVSSDIFLNGYTVYITPNAEHIAAFEEHQSQCMEIEAVLEVEIIRQLFMLAVAGLLMIFVFIMSGYDNGKFRLNKIDKIWAEVYLAAVVLGFALIIAVFSGVLSNMAYWTERISVTELRFYISVAVTFAYVIICTSVNAIIKKLKCRQLIKTSLTGKICIKIRNAVLSLGHQRNNAFFIRYAITTVIFLLWIALGFFVLFAMESVAGLFLIVLMPIIFIILNIVNFMDISKLGKHIENISNGDYSEAEVNKTSQIYKMTENLNSISDSIEKTVEKQVRSERMKIDLVTNVSHDLKTPLTSVISYVNLLKEEEMSDEAKDYVKVLENKTQRLQTIVADLFDLAKATSRTDVNFENLDLTVLVHQVVAEMEDKLKESGKALKIDMSTDKAPIYADGKKLYRVLQNLLDNALKYSLDNTRVYLKLYEIQGRYIINIKNVASYEMKFTPDEITERFVRGDESRTGEGSGLGLSIAKSFTEACKGIFNIKIEDDVFSVCITFNKKSD